MMIMPATEALLRIRRYQASTIRLRGGAVLPGRISRDFACDISEVLGSLLLRILTSLRWRLAILRIIDH